MNGFIQIKILTNYILALVDTNANELELELAI